MYAPIQSTSRTLSVLRFSPQAITSTIWIFLIVIFLAGETANAAQQLKVMKMGLGTGTVTSSDGQINCVSGSVFGCDGSYTTPATVTLTATADVDSFFVRWDGDAAGMPNPATVTMDSPRSVRAVFRLLVEPPEITDFSPSGLQGYLNLHPEVNTPARFIKVLPRAYKQNWLLMSRSESLQTGTAESPRLLLPNENATRVFSIGLVPNASYPGSHPNAIEYMEFNSFETNFLFHEIILAPIPDMGVQFSDTLAWSIPARTRRVSENDAKCSKCHSTRNVLNRSMHPGTTGVSPGTVTYKNKPNWDSYDSWAGLLPFNRDRIYQGSVEAAAFRYFFNVWNWRANDPIRTVIEQLELQPPPVPAVDAITQVVGGANDGRIRFAFDPPSPAPPVTSEPAPAGSAATIMTDYSFDGVPVTSINTDGSSVTRGGSYVRLHHSVTPSDDEGRAVQFFDLLGGADGSLNQQRITDELIRHRFATGSFPIDIRPLALAIARDWIVRSGSSIVSAGGLPGLTVDFSFFDTRHGTLITPPILTSPIITALVDDTRRRSQSIPHRKADREKKNLDRTGDEYLVSVEPGLIQKYGGATSFLTSTSMDRLRQEVFRRPIDVGLSGDSGGTMGSIYVDREVYGSHTEKIALFRYFLEPLGVSVDKWSMGVRGRSRTYTFADDPVYDTYIARIINDLTSNLLADPIPGLDPTSPTQVINKVNSMFGVGALPTVNEVPRFTDVQRIFNKACIECHGGLLYPPYRNGLPPTFTSIAHFDLSEDENPISALGPSPRLQRSYDRAVRGISMPPTLASSAIYGRIRLTSEGCPGGLMPCGGPALSPVDIDTIRRWIVGAPFPPLSNGDTHITTVNGVNYDFQAAGEFTLLRDEYIEIQARQAAVATDGPLGPNPHTGLTTCVSVNTAVAIRIGNDRITYQPDLSEQTESPQLQLRVNGKLTQLTASGVPLGSQGRIIQSTAPDGIQVEAPGGTVIVVIPWFWDYYRVWLMNIDIRGVRATTGLMGTITKENWLPDLPDGTRMGPQPVGLQDRYNQLYDKLGNAWRVTDTTSLFDYASGTSTVSFTIPSWPNGVSNQVCIPPRQLGIADKEPLKRLPITVAEEGCSGVTDPVRRANCIQDVMTTGERGFAELYLRADEINRNTIPEAPVLIAPSDFPTNKVSQRVTLSWNPSSDKDNDPLTYKLALWVAGQPPNNNTAETVSPGDRLTIRQDKDLVTIEWAGTEAELQTAATVEGSWGGLVNAKSPFSVKPAEKAQFFRLKGGGSENFSKTVSGLVPGLYYYWKVIVEDGKGGVAESETRGFEVQ